MFRPTQVPLPSMSAFRVPASHRLRGVFHLLPLRSHAPLSGPITSARAPATRRRFGASSRSLAATGENRCYFLFLRVLGVSVPHVRLQSFRLMSGSLYGLPHSDICGSRCICHSAAAFSQLVRPSCLREPRHPHTPLFVSLFLFMPCGIYLCAKLSLTLSPFDLLVKLFVVFTLVFSLSRLFHRSRFQPCHCLF